MIKLFLPLGLALYSTTPCAQFSDLSLCKAQPGVFESTLYTQCVGIKGSTTQKIHSRISVEQFYHFITQGVKRIESLEAHIDDDAAGRIHAILLGEGLPNFYTTAGNSVLVSTKAGLIIYEKHQGYWLEKMFAGLNEDSRPK